MSRSGYARAWAFGHAGDVLWPRTQRSHTALSSGAIALAAVFRRIQPATPGTILLLRTARHVLVGRRPAIMFICAPVSAPIHAAHAAQRDRALPAPAPRAQDELYDAPRARKRDAIGAGRGSTMNRHTHTARARNEGRGRRTHYQPLRAQRDGRHERSILHTHPLQKCDRVPSECAEPGSRHGRRHGLQLDGDCAASLLR